MEAVVVSKADFQPPRVLGLKSVQSGIIGGDPFPVEVNTHQIATTTILSLAMPTQMHPSGPPTSRKPRLLTTILYGYGKLNSIQFSYS